MKYIIPILLLSTFFLISSTLLGQSSMDDTYSQKKDTIYSHSLDTMTIRTFKKNGKLDWEDNYVKDKLVSVKFWYYNKDVFGYYIRNKRKIKPNIEYRREFYLNNTLKIEGSTIKRKLNGSYKTYHQNGLIQCRCNYIKGEKDGVQIVHFENGQVGVIENYNMGKLNGKTTYYFDNGKIWTEKIYNDNKPWTVLTNFDKKGNAMEKGTLKDGNGTLFIYDEYGKLTEIEFYKNGKLISTEK